MIYGRFNSKLVRLKDHAARVANLSGALFQFQTGSIKSVPCHSDRKR